MSLILKILGILFLVLVIVAGGIIWWLRRKWIEFKRLMDASAIFFPTTIRLLRDHDPSWLYEDGISDLIDELEQIGFNRGNAYQVRELDDLYLCEFIHPTEHVLAVLYTHEVSGSWLEMKVNYASGRQLLVANTPEDQQRDYPPYRQTYFLSGAGVAELWQGIQDHLEEEERREWSHEAFPTVFEATYRQDATWRNQRGGISKAEVRRRAYAQGIKNDDHIQQVFEKAKLEELLRWHEACINQLAAETTLPVAEWHRYGGRFLIVGEVINARSFIDYASEYLEFSNEETARYWEQAETVSTPVLFEMMRKSTPYKIDFIGALDTPIRVDVYGILTEED
ncbi:MAG: hypothetical protein D6675_09980 [Gemmatimonadetes bacterium]|nr:MAG: hypothetical protein D6675_09980 [Gemmatimonadota bacterium]